MNLFMRSLPQLMRHWAQFAVCH